MVIEMKTINRIISITHIASIVACVYLGVYSIQKPIETNDLLFQISLTDGLILSIFLFATIFIGNIFGSIASFLNFSIYPLLSLGLGVTGTCALLLFSKSFNLFLIIFGIISLFQIVVSIWLLFRYVTLMKIGE